MAFNFSRQRRMFHAVQEKQRKEYEAAGMNEEQMLAMHEIDLHQFNRDVAYGRRKLSLSSDFGQEDEGNIVRRMPIALAVVQQPSQDKMMWWLDEIEDTVLSCNLMRLTLQELEMIDLLVYRGYTQKEISVMKGKSPAAISFRLKAIREKLKSGMEHRIGDVKDANGQGPVNSHIGEESQK